METVKGFRDIEDASKRIVIKNLIESTFRLYGFRAVETPIIEYEEFVKGENERDEAVSDVFKLKDKGERNLALRYEFTFQLKRLANNKKLPYKRYQIGEVFRDEPATGNRWRQFTQCDADIVGSSSKDEIEILRLISKILDKLGIKFTININNRRLLNEILNEFELDDKGKMQIMREIDKLDKLPEQEIKNNLKKYNAGELLDIFKKPENYFEKFQSYKNIKELIELCSLYKIKVNFQPFLVRGLSYYNGSIFEVKSESNKSTGLEGVQKSDKISGIKETIAAGGSYLINGIQATGISFGLDRLELISKIALESKRVLIISLNQNKKAIELCDKIRNTNVICEVAYGKPAKALDYANSYFIPFVIFIGDEEIKKKKYKLKNMASGKEKLVSEIQLLKILNK